MILGIGCDIVSIERIQRVLDRFGSHFAAKILSEDENKEIHGPLPIFLAGRFAAKEACAKAFGTGFRNGLAFPHIEVKNNALGRPILVFREKAHSLAQELGVHKAFLSISHEQSHAVAFVILEGEENGIF